MRIEHGKLENFVNDGMLASQAEPELFGHFIAWNEVKGKVRDSKVAYPVIGLRSVTKSDWDLAENAVAHLMKLSPRDLVRAYDFNKWLTGIGQPIKAGFRSLLEQGLKDYLQARENVPGWWDRTVLQHRDSMKRLYRISHKRPSAHAQAVLFDGKYPAGSIFEKVSQLRTMDPKTAASVIIHHKIPFEVIVGSVNVKDTSVLLAMLEGMTGNQVVTNSKMLEKLGVKKDPMLKAAYDAALQRASVDKKLNVLKAGVAAERAEDAGELLNLQARATKQLGGIEGDWLILGDCSGSMSQAIELAKKIAALITEQVKGKVWLVFFNTVPTAYEVTGKTYFQISDMTKRIGSGGGTSIGCGLDYISANGHEVDGIAIVSDGGDNTHPYFQDAYRKYAEKLGKEPTVYLFKTSGDYNALTSRVQAAGYQMEEFDMTRGVDYYSLPNVVATLRTNRYSLVDEIMAQPLLKLADAFRRKDN